MRSIIRQVKAKGEKKKKTFQWKAFWYVAGCVSKPSELPTFVSLLIIFLAKLLWNICIVLRTI